MSESAPMDPDASFVLLDSFSSLQASVDCLDSFDSLDLEESGDQARNGAESVSIEIMDSFSSVNTFLADGGIVDDNCCIANADSNFQDVDKSSSYLRVTSTPRRTMQLIDTSTATRGDKAKYMEGSPA